MDTTPATRETNAIAQFTPPAPQVLKSDIIVPYITLGQGMSQAVIERKVQLGDIYRSTSGEVLGNPDKAIEAIFLHYPRADWVIEQKGKQKFEYRSSMARTASNETLPWSYWADDDGNEMEAGQKGASEWRRVKRLTVFAILPADIDSAMVEMAKADKGELPDPAKALTPVAFSFRSTGYNTGKEICTFYSQAQSMKVPIWRYQVPMFDTLESNDDGSFYVWKTDRTKAKGVKPEHLAMVSEWAMLINQGAPITVHEEGDTGSVQGTGRAEREVNVKNAKEVC